MRYAIIISVIMFALAGISSPVEAADTGKVGYVDLSRVFDEYNKTQELDKELEKKGTAKQTERDKKVGEIKGLKEELELLSDQGREKKQTVIDKKIMELQEFDQDAQTELKRERDAMVRDILQEIDKVIQDYGRNKGYGLILNNRVLLYGEKEADLTDAVLGVLNAQYKK